MRLENAPKGYFLIAIDTETLYQIAQCAGTTGKFSIVGKKKRFPLKFIKSGNERPFYFIESEKKNST